MHLRHVQKLTVGNNGFVGAGTLPGTLKRCSSVHTLQRPSTALLVPPSTRDRKGTNGSGEFLRWSTVAYGNFGGGGMAFGSKPVPPDCTLLWRRKECADKGYGNLSGYHTRSTEKCRVSDSCVNNWVGASWTGRYGNAVLVEYLEGRSGMTVLARCYQRREYSTFIERIKKFFNVVPSSAPQTKIERKTCEGDIVPKEEPTNPPETKKTLETIEFQEAMNKSQPKICNGPQQDPAPFSMPSGNDLEVEGKKSPPFMSHEGCFCEDRASEELPDLRILKLQRDYELRRAELREKEASEAEAKKKFHSTCCQEEVEENVSNEECETLEKFEKENTSPGAPNLTDECPSIDPEKDKFSIVDYCLKDTSSVLLLPKEQKCLIKYQIPSKIMEVGNDEKTVIVNLKRPPQDLKLIGQLQKNKFGTSNDPENSGKRNGIKGTIGKIRVNHQLNPIPRKNTLSRNIRIFVSDRLQPVVAESRRRTTVPENILRIKAMSEKTMGKVKFQEGVKSERILNEKKEGVRVTADLTARRERPEVMAPSAMDVAIVRSEASGTAPHLVSIPENDPVTVPETVQKDYDTIESEDLLYVSSSDREPCKAPTPRCSSSFLRVDGSFENQMSKALRSNLLWANFQRTNTTECPKISPQPKNVFKIYNSNDNKKENVGSSANLESDFIIPERYDLKMDELQKIEAAVKDIEKHVANLPNIVECAVETPLENFQRIVEVTAAKKRMEEKINLVKLVRPKAERKVKPITYFEERKVKPIKLDDSPLYETRKVKPITIEDIFLFQNAEEPVFSQTIGEIQFKPPKDFPEKKKNPFSLKGYRHGSFRTEIKEYKSKISSGENQVKAADGSGEAAIGDEIEENRQEGEVVILEYVKKEEKKKRDDLRIYGFDHTDKDKLELKFFEGTSIAEDSLYSPKSPNERMKKELPLASSRKYFNAETMAYQVGGGHSLLCQIKNMQDAKMRNSMRDSMRFMEQVREQLRWDFGDSYTKEVVHVNPDLKTSTTRILPHDPTTPYSQIYIKLNDFKIMSVQADARKKDSQTVRGLLKDQGKKLLCPFQNLGGVQKRDHNTTVFQIPISKSEDDVESSEKVAVIDYLTGDSMEEDLPFIQIHDPLETIRAGTKLAFWGRKKKGKKDSKGGGDDKAKTATGSPPGGNKNNNKGQKKKPFGSLFSSLFKKKPAPKKEAGKEATKEATKEAPKPGAPPVVSKAVQIKPEEVKPKPSDCQLKTVPKKKCVTLSEKLAKICPKKPPCPEKEPDIVCYKSDGKGDKKKAREKAESPCKKPEFVKEMVNERDKVEAQRLRQMEMRVKSDTMPQVQVEEVNETICHKILRAKALASKKEKAKDQKKELKGPENKVLEKPSLPKPEDQVLLLPKSSASPTDPELCEADQRAKMAKEIALREKCFEDKLREAKKAAMPQKMPCNPYIIDTAYLMSPFSLKFDTAAESGEIARVSGRFPGDDKKCQAASNFDRALRKEKEIVAESKKGRRTALCADTGTCCFRKHDPPVSEGSECTKICSNSKHKEIAECSICKKFDIIDSPPKVIPKKATCRQQKCGKRTKICPPPKKKPENICAPQQEAKKKDFCGACQKPPCEVECPKTKLPKRCTTYKKSSSCFKPKPKPPAKAKSEPAVCSSQTSKPQEKVKKAESPASLKTTPHRRTTGPRCPKQDAIKEKLLPTPPMKKRTTRARVAAIIDDAFRKHKMKKCQPKKRYKCEQKKDIKVITACEQRVLDAKQKEEMERIKKEQDAKAKAYKQLVHTVWKPTSVKLDDHFCCKKPPTSDRKDKKEGPPEEGEKCDHVIKPDLGVKYQSPRYGKAGPSSDCRSAKPSRSPADVVQRRDSTKAQPMSRCLPLFPMIKNAPKVPKDDDEKEK